MTLDNGDVVTFSFKVMSPQKENQQAFFAYKLTVGQVPAHTHSFGTTWTTDGESHWHECECGEKADVADHTGGSANCVTPATCEICDQPYGEKDPDTHTGNTEIRGYAPATTTAPGYTGDTHCKDCGAKLKSGEPIPQLHSHRFGTAWTTDGESHWHECECGEKQDEGTHTYKKRQMYRLRKSRPRLFPALPRHRRCFPVVPMAGHLCHQLLGLYCLCVAAPEEKNIRLIAKGAVSK